MVTLITSTYGNAESILTLGFHIYGDIVYLGEEGIWET